MDLEDLIVGLVAGLALLWWAVVWLKEQLDKPQKTPVLTTTPRPISAPRHVELETRLDQAPHFGRKEVLASARLPAATERGRSLRQQLGLDQRSTLQRSIILMIVLGPCQANKRGKDTYSDTSFL